MIRRAERSVQTADTGAPAFLAMCVLFAAAAAAMSFIVVLHWAPDEPEHLKYIAALAHGHFPNAVESKEAFQAPLYYIVCAPLYRLLQGFSSVAAEHAVRLLSVAFGVGVLVLVRKTAGMIFFSRAAQLASVAVVAFHPFFVYLMGVCNNDVLFILLAAAVVYQLIRANITERPRDYLLLGVCLGLAFLTKFLALAFFPLPIIGAGIGLLRRKEPGTVLRSTLLCLGAAAAVSLPWLLRNLIVHGDLFYDILRPSSTEIAWFQDRIAHGLAPPDSLLEGVSSLARGIFLSFWAPKWVIRTYLDPEGPGYLVVGLLLLLFPAIGLLRAIRAREEYVPVLLLLMAAPLLLSAAVIRYALTWDYSIVDHGGRYLLGTLPVLAVATGALIEGLAGPARKITAAAVVAAYGLLALLTLLACYDFYTSGVYLF